MDIIWGEEGRGRDMLDLRGYIVNDGNEGGNSYSDGKYKLVVGRVRKRRFTVAYFWILLQ